MIGATWCNEVNFDDFTVKVKVTILLAHVLGRVVVLILGSHSLLCQVFFFWGGAGMAQAAVAWCDRSFCPMGRMAMVCTA